MNGNLESEIENFAYCYLEKDEIAIVCGVDVDDLKDRSHDHGRAFLKGRIKRKAEFHNSIIQLSKQLSSPAMQIEQKIAEQTFLNDSKTR